MPSSLISTLARHQDRLPNDLSDDTERLIALAEVLDHLPDPRRTRRRRYRRLSPRYEHHPRNHLAFLGLAAALCCDKRYVRLNP